MDAVYAAIPPEYHERLRYEWRAWARPEQLPPPGDWYTWIILAGRGFGKTRMGSEWIRLQAELGADSHLILAGPTAGDLRDVMIEGESGILAVSPPWFRPTYEPSKLRLTWPNGVVAWLLSADEPDRFRGKQATKAWCDELAAWRYAEEAWSQVMICTRLPGKETRVVATTTPRPTDIIKNLVASPDTVVTRGSTFDNAENLSPKNLAMLRAKYDGTRIGRQELYAELLLDTPGALWTADRIDAKRVSVAPPTQNRAVVGVDPSGSSHRKSDEAGIVTAALAFCACKGNPRDLHGFVLSDDSGVMSPDKWGLAAAKAFRDFRADKVVGERNYGGDMVETIIKHADSRVTYADVVASRGKAIRAAPIAALYEQGRVHHVGYFPKLETEMTTYDPLTSTISPGRLDALVWALTELMGGLVGDPGEIKSEGSSFRWSRRNGII